MVKGGVFLVAMGSFFSFAYFVKYGSLRIPPPVVARGVDSA